VFSSEVAVISIYFQSLDSPLLTMHDHAIASHCVVAFVQIVLIAKEISIYRKV